MFEISKVIEFSAAHSVYSQKLNPEWTKNTYPKCRRLPGHGHNYRLVVYLKSENLDFSQMVTDFGHLSWLKSFVDSCFDHKLILGMDDPALHLFFTKLGLMKNEKLVIPQIDGKKTEVDVVAVDGNYRIKKLKIREVDLSEVKSYKYFSFQNFKSDSDSVEADFYQRLLDGLSLFSGSPTSENLARFFFYFVSENIKPLGIKCSKVSIHETPTSCATFKE
ncbi:6-carboxytetrahydropterin synthase [Desulfurobacterium thermolithotrophum]|uniref:6-carboxytetrahydropterin synthase n=1 Tax=Desulfurobacterium thermolithotrophum TaxID=64160 RepID=UPI0013D6DFEA|nr:6-carboxytetrahydropterin synthase [Desulfurobacterium thermolithotrophum]